jgi:hypothetical protein
MNTYEIHGNVIRVNFPQFTEPPQKPALQIVDGDLLNHLYDRAQYVAHMGKGYMKQTIYKRRDSLAAGKTTVFQFTKAQLKKIDKMADYSEKLNALKYTVACANLFGVACQLHRDADGVMLRSFEQVTQDMIDEQVEIERFRMTHN